MILSNHHSESEISAKLVCSSAEHRALCRRIEASVQDLRYANHDIRVHGVSWGESQPGNRISPHQHSYYEAILIVGGKAMETVGKQQTLLPGTLQLHVPGSIHGWSAPDTALLRFAICFSLSPVVHLHPMQNWPVQSQALSELDELLITTRHLTPGTSDRLNARLLLFLAHFLDMLAWPAPDLQRELRASWPLRERVEQFLCDNINRPLTLADIATVTHQSIPTLTRRYREDTGQSVIDRFNELRLEHAARLLKSTKFPVKDIATRVGYGEASYFCRRFREQFHTSPQLYRKQAINSISIKGI